MAFSEFTVRASGSNLYAGSLDGSAEASTTPLVTYASGSLVAATGVFTVASGNPVADGVTDGQFASLYPDGTTGATVFVSRITARTTTTITVSLTAKSGTIPTDGTGNRTLVVGGAWAGPGGTSGFPLNFVQSTMTDASANRPRINFKNDQTYSVTANTTMNNNGPFRIRGYTSSFGDGGMATISGGTSGASYIVLTVNGNEIHLCDLAFANNGATGSANGVVWQGSYQSAKRVVFSGMRGGGTSLATAAALLMECEAYGNNLSNSANMGGFMASGTAMLRRCISHDNTGSNSAGFHLAAAVALVNCIADTNGGPGIRITAGGNRTIGCDSYNNTSDGITTSSTDVYIENCNLVKNGGYGINCTGSVPAGFIESCGFGSGTQVNTSGTTNGTGSVNVSGSVNYTADITPWVDPANGDFRINLVAAKNTGRGAYTQTASSYAGTVGYPDIGAAQHVDAGGGGCPVIGNAGMVIRGAAI